MIPRHAHQDVRKALGRQTAVALIGPRQVGKTLLEPPGAAQPWAVEIKLGLAPTLGRGFHHAREDVRPERCFVVYSGTERYPLAQGVEAIGLREMAELVADA